MNWDDQKKKEPKEHWLKFYSIAIYSVDNENPWNMKEDSDIVSMML